MQDKLLARAVVNGGVDLELAVTRLREFPYQQRPFCARNWGHPLHSLCSYPSKLKPGLGHFLVRLFTQIDDVVLDPFAGAGTVPFEACTQGRIGIGSDLSPFAHLVTAAKVAPPSTRELAKTFAILERQLPRAALAVDLASVEPEIRSFFHDDTCREVVAAKNLLIHTALGSTPSGRFLSAALCHILHGNRPYALSRRSHGIIPIPPKGQFVYKSVLVSLAEKVKRTKFDQIPQSFTRGFAHQMDAFALELENESVDAIITSPPFLGTTEFLRQNRVRLWFCGMDYAEQLSKKPRFLEYHRDLAGYELLLRGWARVLRPGGRLVMHLGVVGRRDMAEEIAPLAKRAGFEVHAIVYEPTRHLESHGRMDRGATHTHEVLIATYGRVAHGRTRRALRSVS